MRGNSSSILPNVNQKNGLTGNAGQNATYCRQIGCSLRACGHPLDDDMRELQTKFRYNVQRFHTYCVGSKDSNKCPIEHAVDETAPKKPASPIQLNVAPVIFDYKNFLFENITVPVFLQTIRQTQKILELGSDMSATSVFSSFALEANALEKQFYKSTDKYKLLPFHENLLRRIENYTMQTNEVLSPQNKQILSLIYSVIYSKTTEIRSSHSSDLIIDIEKFFELIIEKIHELETISKTKVINEQRVKYNEEIAAKRQEAIDFIRNDIEPEVEKMFSKLDEEMDKTIDEVKSMQSDAKDEIEKKEKDYKTMRRNVEIRGFFR